MIINDFLSKLQADPGSSVAAADVVQAAADSAGHQEGARRWHPGSVRAAGTLAGSCKLNLNTKSLPGCTNLFERGIAKENHWV